MKIKKLEKQYYKKYEEFVLSFEYGMLYYSIKYKSLLEEVLGLKSNYLILLNEENDIQAILPLMKKKGKFGTIINTLPFYGSNGGILAKNNKAYNALLEYYYELLLKVSGGVYVSNPMQGVVNDLKNDMIDRRVGQWTKINYSDNFEDNIILSYHKKTRNLVRKAIKLNLNVKIDNSAMEFLYKTHVENITSIGGIPKDNFFFNTIEKIFKKGRDYNIYVAYLNEKKIGAILLLYYNNIVEYFTPVVVSEFRSYQSTSLIIYKAMIDASKNNYKWWNWGGTWLSQNGVYHFKKRFGAVDREYKYFIKINNPDIYNASKEEILKEYGNFYVIKFDMLEAK